MRNIIIIIRRAGVELLYIHTWCWNKYIAEGKEVAANGARLLNSSPTTFQIVDNAHENSSRRFTCIHKNILGEGGP